MFHIGLEHNGEAEPLCSGMLPFDLLAKQQIPHSAVAAHGRVTTELVLQRQQRKLTLSEAVPNYYY